MRCDILLHVTTFMLEISTAGARPVLPLAVSRIARFMELSYSHELHPDKLATSMYTVHCKIIIIIIVIVVVVIIIIILFCSLFFSFFLFIFCIATSIVIGALASPSLSL